MPTGYTADVMDGKQTEFSDFAMSCARAFGALITMRDEPSDAPIPVEFRPSTWNADRLIEARAKLERLRAMTPAEADAAAQAAYDDAAERAEKYDAEKAEENKRLDSMLEKVSAWSPPTAEHVGLKAFMVEQLTISKREGGPSKRPSKPTGKDWLDAAVKEAMREIGYHAKAQAEEDERTRARTAWVSALRQSLQSVP